jgi:hypothetical protein
MVGKPGFLGKGPDMELLLRIKIVGPQLRHVYEATVTVYGRKVFGDG